MSLFIQVSLLFNNTFALTDQKHIAFVYIYQYNIKVLGIIAILHGVPYIEGVMYLFVIP